MWNRRSEETGWILLETVLLGLIALSVAAAVGIFAPAALLEEHASARMEAALLARAQLSRMEAQLDAGIAPVSAVTTIASGARSYEMETSAIRTAGFYDVEIRLSWRILGRVEEAVFVRRMRCHVQTQSTP